MKKILGLTVVALMVMGLVGGGTWAYFSDVESSVGNTLAAGTLDLEVDSENPWTSVPISVIDIAPGDSAGSTNITCKNVGNLVGDLYLKITNVTDGGGTLAYPVGSEVCSSEPEYVAENGLVSWAAIDNVSANLTVSCDAGGSPVATIDTVKLDSVPSTWTLIKDDLGAGANISLDLDFTLEALASNEFQGDNCTFDIELYMQQYDRPAP